jgi:hypothetical protein
MGRRVERGKGRQDQTAQRHYERISAAEFGLSDYQAVQHRSGSQK